MSFMCLGDSAALAVALRARRRRASLFMAAG
jgi:hypothetical protein